MVAVDGYLSPPGTHAGRPAWLRPWLAWLDAGLDREVVRLRARYDLGADELRGLYVSDEQVDALLARRTPDPADVTDPDGLAGRRDALLVGARGRGCPLGAMASRFALGHVELLALVVALAPEVDLSYQALFAYLNDDASRRLPSVDLVQRLAGGQPLEPTDPVVTEGLVEVLRVPGAPLWRSAGLVLAEPVRALLLGTDPLAGERVAAPQRVGLVLLESRSPLDAVRAAEQLAAHDGRALVRLDPSVADGATRLRRGLLRARLHDAALLVPAGEPVTAPDPDAGPVEQTLPASVLAELADSPVTVLLEVRPGGAARLPLGGVDHQRIVVDRPDPGVRAALWRCALATYGLEPQPDALSGVATLFALGPSQVVAAAAAVARSGDCSSAGLSAAAREQVTRGVAGLAERIDPLATWEDLVLPPAVRGRLRELEGAIRTRHLVFDDWGLARLSGGHSSVRALFSGPSGTGKSMSAAVLAGSLGLALHRVDLSAVVSKYIGETEKNLARVFEAAEDGGAILFFDEADALFGRRTEVKDAHDRYANIETSFLLQRMESFDGLVILATNLAGNLDEAFSRRVHVHVEFPVPDAALREQLWRRALPPAVPVADDVDPVVLAGMLPLTGGEVRNAALMAAFAAAREGTQLGMGHLVRALARQRRQQGKVPSASEFGPYLHLAREEVG